MTRAGKFSIEVTCRALLVIGVMLGGCTDTACPQGTAEVNKHCVRNETLGNQGMSEAGMSTQPENDDVVGGSSQSGMNDRGTGTNDRGTGTTDGGTRGQAGSDTGSGDGMSRGNSGGAAVGGASAGTGTGTGTGDAASGGAGAGAGAAANGAAPDQGSAGDGQSSNGKPGDMTSSCIAVGETCNNADDDCDGRVDEAVEKDCGSSTRGICKLGKQACTAGTWSDCVGAIEPKTEVCDAAKEDENCDGAANEGCECTSGQPVPCGSDEGTCKKGTQACTGGKLSKTCEGEVGPKQEVCDAAMEDENCDGRKNEGCECINGQGKSCGSDEGACKKGMQACNNGKLSPTCEGAVGPKTEVCDAAKEDENCDGRPNEGCECVVGQMIECGSDTGACRKGTKTCTAEGKYPSTCSGEVTPRSEVCDGNDDEDCDGRPDDTDCECIDGKTMGCTTSGIGVCAQGKRTCSGGKWSSSCQATRTNCVCDDAAAPRECPGGSDVGECRPGTQRCVNGQWGNCENARTRDSSEKCDGKDGNCNGRDDEEDKASCPSGQRCDGRNCVPVVTEPPPTSGGSSASNINYYRKCTSDGDCMGGICSNASTPNFCSPRANEGPCPQVPGFSTGIFFQTGCVIVCPSMLSGDCPGGMKCIANPFGETASHHFCVPGGSNAGL